MRLQPVYLDFESFWSTTHTLSKMTNIEYVMHPDTEIISLAIAVANGPVQVYFGEADIRTALRAVDWSKSMVVGHNMSGFDSLILAWRFGINPAMWGCTLAMARERYNADVGGSLASLVKFFKAELEAMGISGVKDNSALVNTKGKHLVDFTPEELKAMKVYNKDDTEQCRGLFKILAKGFPSKELLQVDLTTRMITEPQFEVDTPLLTQTLTLVQEEKLRSLKELTDLLATTAEQVAHVLETGTNMEVWTRDQLMSSAKFAELLTLRGVEVPMKASPSNPAKEIPALSKTDQEFLDLQEHDDPVVAAAARARLEAKSTLLETRIGKFLAVSKPLRGMIPMPLRYAGATTTGRWSGETFNPQNLPRILPGSPKLSDCLRNSLRAPKGFKVVTSDLSGIELRVNMFLWKVGYAMDLFERDPAKADLYKSLASEVLGVPVDEIVKMQRQAGKAMHLGCGFGLGSTKKYIAVAKTMAQIDVTEDDAAAHIAGYRRKHPEIVQGWKTCHKALDAIYSGIEQDIDPWGLCKTGKDHIKLPSGRKIWYPGLHKEMGDNGKPEWWYGTGRNRARIYAGKVTENCIAEGTEVLTRRGWVPIERISLDDEVHDGVEFVLHGGIINKSVQSCIAIDGVLMTPDHEVLTNEGWKAALENPRPVRPDLRGVKGIELGGYGRTSPAMEVSVHLRKAGHKSGRGRDCGSEARGDTELWVYDAHPNQQGKLNTQHVEASGVRCVPLNGRQVPAAYASGMGQLRRARDYGVRAVEYLRELLGGYGRFVPAGVGLGPQGQRRRIFPGELPMDYSQGKHHEQTQYRDTSRCARVEPRVGDWEDHTVQQAKSRLAAGAVGNPAGLQKPVYDILNCGPRHRFVVRGAEAPFIVHNCVQALARDVIAEVVRNMHAHHGMRPALLVHDEVVIVVKESRAEEIQMKLDAAMRAPTSWWPELIKWSESDTGDTYGSAH